MYLGQEAIATAVVASLRRGELLGHYELGAFAILANHVHMPCIIEAKGSDRTAASRRNAREAPFTVGSKGEAGSNVVADEVREIS